MNDYVNIEQKTEGRGQWTDNRGQKTVDKQQTTHKIGHKTEDKIFRLYNKCQKAEESWSKNKKAGYNFSSKIRRLLGYKLYDFCS